MEGCQSSVFDPSWKQQQRWDRREATRRLAGFESAQGGSQRELVQQLGVPRSTLRHWIARKESLDLDPQLAEFLESPVGVAFLHRLVVAAHLVFTQIGPCGIRPLCQFLELSQLDRVVASSYGAQQSVSMAMQEAIIEFGQQEQARLAKQMPAKEITVCEDETFHPKICLVAIEPVSNFILLEVYAENRNAETWSQLMVDALHEMPVDVIQATSDESRGLIAHARDSLGAHHSPDLFHVQQELSRATSGTLSARVRQAEKQLQPCCDKLQQLKIQRDACAQQCPEAVDLFERQIQQAEVAQCKAEADLKACQNRQADAQAIIRGIGDDYHPFDLQTGTPAEAEHVAAKLNARFDEMEQTAADVNLSERCQNKIQKARRVLDLMVATIAFFWRMIRAKVQSLSLSAELEAAFYQTLLPGRYLQMVAQKAATTERRKEITTSAEQLLFRARDGPLRQLTEQQWRAVDEMAVECARLFQRSSSCVEGRNGQLALRHHSLHQLTPKKLGTLTTLHNYYVQRDDNTTAAERFFGTPPRDLFEWLLGQIPVPARPAASSRQKPR